jgi:ferredoxin/flavodoxin---NADP+ reductase
MPHELSCAAGTSGHVVLANTPLAPDVHRLVVRAPRVAHAARPGQFVIVRLGEGAERIPLTIVEHRPDDGSIVLVIQAVGASTTDLVALRAGDVIDDLAGPLGRPSELVADGVAVCVAGGVGAAVMLPVARALATAGVDVVTVLGARTSDGIVLHQELTEAGEVIVCTDDGTAGRAGTVTDALADLLATRRIDVVYAAGPVPMMRAVAAVTRPLGVTTVVSLNPIMVDGTGMCGGCRVTVGGEMRFACVDGPEFDAHLVDFDELADRLRTYREAEQVSRERSARSAP